MPQMSPLMWVVLLFLFILLYFLLGVVLYFKFYLNDSGAGFLSGAKFSVIF